MIVANADRIIDLLHEAKARPAGAERAQFLAEACGDDVALKEQIISLLEAEAKEGESDFLKVAAFLRPTIPPSEKPGDRIGRYKLLEQIGEGGCGIVYMAEQLEPMRRRVALKVIKLGMDTKQVIARFEAERQALALMDHPNIAKVLDAGATETGRPFFVMELVRGIKITEYCDENNLPTTERLKLFIQICQAVQHAHQKGIIHRDIKPSNILVTHHDDVAVPKVIDFGIAKATTGQLTDKTVFTAFAQFIGTPAYMSPEQAQMSGLDVDTRSDIYSLGVLLYELLTGHTPFDAKELLAAGMDEMRRRIREDEPAKPSTRLSTMQAMDLTTVAKRRHVEPPGLIYLIRGDLDWLVMKCLEKDRTRRYETANGLAMDIQRHLNNEPVTACPPSRWYEFQKTVRRHKFGFAAAAAVTAALALGFGMSTWMYFKEKQARERMVAAEQEQTRLRRHAEAEVAESRRVARFLGTLASSLRSERNLTNSESAYRESLALWKRLPGDEPREVDVALKSLARVLHQQGKLAEAGMTAREAAQKCHTELAHYEKLASDWNRHQECWNFAESYEALGQFFAELGQTQEAERAYRDTQVLWRKLVAEFNIEDDRWHLAINYDLLGSLLRQAGRATESLEAYRDAQAVWRKLVTDFNTEDRRYHLAMNYDAIGQLLKEAGRFDEATEAYRQALAVWKQLVLDFNHDDRRSHLSWTAVSLAAMLQTVGKLAEAEQVYRDTLAAYGKTPGFGGSGYGLVLQSLIALLKSENKLADAKTLLSGLLSQQRQSPGVQPLTVTLTLLQLANILAVQNQADEAANHLREALAITANLGAEATNARAFNSVAWQLVTAEAPTQWDAAVAVELAQKAVAATDRKDPMILDTLAAAYAAVGRFTNAVGVQQEAIALLPDEQRKKDYASRLALYQAGIPLHRDPAALARKVSALLAQGKFAEAEQPARQCLTLRGKQMPDDWLTFNARNLLGGSLLGQKKFAEAEPMLLSGYEGMRQRADKIPTNGKVRVKENLQRLVQLYEATDQPEKAAEWNKALAEFDKIEAEKKATAPKP